ncbi:GOLPH3/VPS74 family protein [Nocardioides sp. MAHUQ-72]|uniref:GOLPH3/VPS74 family protein n=1 Tax=unclassified Nocardioides TaxID=2615069 RepID=UPI00361785E9
MGTLIAEDLLLLLLDDEKGTLSASSYADTALGGALLTELALLGAVTVPEKTSVWRSARVLPVAAARVEDPLLAEALATVAEKQRPAQDLVVRLGKGLRGRLAARLVERGILERHDSRALGLFPRKRWPTRDAGPELRVRAALTAVLVQGARPDERTAALVALLAAIDRAHKVVDHPGVSSREVRRRAKEVAEGAWAAKAVRDAIQAATAAITAAIAAGAVAAGASGSG